MIEPSSKLAKAQELAKNNPQLAKALDPALRPHYKIKARQKRLKHATKAIQDFYGEELPKSSILLVKPDSKDPLSLPLSRQRELFQQKNFKEVEKMAILNLKKALNTNFQQNDRNDENDENGNVKSTTSITSDCSDYTADNTLTFDVGVVANMISFDEYKAMEDLGEVEQDNYQTQFPQTDNTGICREINTSTLSSTIISTDNSRESDNKEDKQKVSLGENKPKRRRGRPCKIEKLSQSLSPISSPDSLDEFSVLPLKVKSQSSPIGVGKTSLTYLSIYSNALTPDMLDKLVNSNETKLNLTISEIAALKLMKKMLQDDEKAEKLYWNLQKDLEKHKKPQQIRKAETTLLEHKLREAKDAILSDKPIDEIGDPS